MIGTSLQHLQIVVYVCALAISTAAIAGRLWARWMTGRKLQSNDYLMVIAYVSVLVMLSIALCMVDRGELGVHKADIEPARYTSVARYLGEANFIMSMLMMVATSLVKLSITEFYLHIFPHGWLHHVCHIQLVALTLFMIGQIVAILTICQPVAASFDFSIHGKCGDIVDFWLSISIIALFFDISCVILPMPIFWTTNLCQRKKWKLTVLFGLGFIICGLTGVRVWVYRVIDFNDTTWGYAHGTMLTIIEPSLGILAGCIPIMSPCLASLARRVKSGFPLVKGGATANSPKAGGGGNKRISNPFKRLEDHMYPLTDVKVSHATETRRSSTEALTEDVLNIGGITVHREIVVDSVYEDWQSRQHRPRD